MVSLILVAAVLAEVRADLLVKAHSLGEGWLAVPNDAQRGEVAQSNLLSASLCGHHQDHREGGRGPHRNSSSEVFHWFVLVFLLLNCIIRIVQCL